MKINSVVGKCSYLASALCGVLLAAGFTLAVVTYVNAPQDLEEVDASNLIIIMSLGLFGIPNVVCGVIALWFSQDSERRRAIMAMTIPWFVVLVVLPGVVSWLTK